jgi:voltage-gated potassium channel
VVKEDAETVRTNGGVRGVSSVGLLHNSPRELPFLIALKKHNIGKTYTMATHAHGEKVERWRKLTDTPLTIIAIGSLPVLFLHFVSDRLSSLDKKFILIVDLIVLTAFLLDYVVELILSNNKTRYIKTEWLNAIVTIAQAVALLPSLGIAGIFRAVRGVRIILTVLRILGISASVSRNDGRRLLREKAATLAFGLAGFTWVTSAVAFTVAEDVGQEGRLNSFFDALWWSATTITTVGYGDIYPVTAIGRLIAIFTMLVGIGTLAVVTARIAKFLIRE